MKKLVISLLIVVGLSVIAVVALDIDALNIDAGPEYIFCHGNFNSKAAADRAVEAVEDLDFDIFSVVRTDDDVDGYWPVEFETGERGDEFRELRREFRKILRRERGKSGYGKGDCAEPPPFDRF